MWTSVTMQTMRVRRLVSRNTLTSALCNLSSHAQAVSKLPRAEPELIALGASLLLILREACMSSAEA